MLVSRADREILAALYVRSQLQDGYYFKKNGREMVTLTNPAYSGTDEELLERIHREHLQDRPRLGVDVEAEFLTGKPAKVILRRGESVGRAIGNLVQAAKSQPVTEENLRRQLGKLGESPFAVSEMQLQVSRDAFYPLKEINELRRQAVQALEAALWKAEEQSDRTVNRYSDINDSEYKESPQESFFKQYRPVQSICEHANRPVESMNVVDTSECPGLTISVRTLDQLKALEGYLARSFSGESGETSEKNSEKCCEKTNGLVFRRLYVDSELLLQESRECLTICKRIFSRMPQGKSSQKPKLVAALPYILRENEMHYLEKLWGLTEQYGLDGFLVRSLDELGFLLKKEQESSRRIYLRTDAGVYIWNSETLRQLYHLADGFCLPYELKASEQSSLLQRAESECSRISWEKIIYGRIPLMVTANCVQKTTDRCIGEGDGILWLEDRYHTEFPVLRTCARCLNIIYNSVPLALFDSGERWKNITDLRLDFTIETGQELIQLLQTYLEGNRLSQAHTTGHEKRGVK